jgi:iron complex transport system substrate-binding protein
MVLMLKKLGLTLVVGLLISILTLSVGCRAAVDDSPGEVVQTPETATITDMAGREITVRVPAERVVLASARHLHEFAAVAAKKS